MATPQLAYTYYHTDGDPGTLADMKDHQTDTLVNGDVVALPFGIGVKVVDLTAILPGSGDVIGGIILKTLDVDTVGLVSPNWLKVGASMAVMRKGRVKVLVEEAVNVGDDAFCRFVAGAGGAIVGSWRKSADTASAAAVKGATFCRAAPAGAVAWLDFDYQLAAS